MKKTFTLSALAALAATTAVVAPASAATTVYITDPAIVSGSAALPLTTVTGDFDYIFLFKIPNRPGTVAGATITSDSGVTTFSSVTLNNVALTPVSTAIGYMAVGTAPRMSDTAVYQRLEVVGTTTNGATGAFGGTVSFIAAVPESSTWAMMIAGFGLMGGALRTARKTKVAFA